MRGGREKSDVLNQAARSPIMLISSRYFFWCFKTKARKKFCDLAYHFCCLVQSNRHDKLAKKLVHSRKEPSLR